MHGRLKVKTTAEQQEAKRKEREKKLKLYNAGTKAAFKKRENGEYDEEGLKITGEILAVNPDFYTLWNFRKEIFVNFLQTRETEEVQKIMENELYFLESCLKVNPKSYGTWHHRTFIMENMPKPDWDRELQLCNTFLDYDERNFHCWDYRRFVVMMAEVSLDDELGFTTQKITTNFSNYSSWHYRSKLLPMLHPDPTQPAWVQEDVILKEFEIVQNAVFTDPDDQSAWFYHRWLLGRGKKKQQISCIHASRKTKRITVLLTRPIMVGRGNSLILSIHGKSVAGQWKTPTGSSSFSVLWIKDLTESIPEEKEVSVSVTLIPDIDKDTQFSQGLQIDADQEEAWVMADFKSGSRFSNELSAATSSTLETELESIKELHGVEPDNKWVLLTMFSLMMAIDRTHSMYKLEIRECIDQLIQVDLKREAYYRDTKSKFILQSILETQDKNAREMSLKDEGLTALYHTEWMLLLTSIDLSNNALSTVKSLSNLRCLKCLCLDNNHLKDLDGLQHCHQLCELSVKINDLNSAEDLYILENNKCLVKINVYGNPLCRYKDHTTKIKKNIPSLLSIDDNKCTSAPS
ncbi:geranylgeranyl transferase type-2 subunit alpha-like isoform X2 [Mytilus galloprovincialis]|uniref:geranylgeranyl transferase type-2 subunit alpha-like isoform X1 n=1 Tax=Mytilus galloprovincialis TaxID=29158 RepID=UPI003F7CCE98